MRPYALAAALVLSGCASAPGHPGTAPATAAVRGARYIAPADTQFYGLWQLATISFVRGRDTLRVPMQSFRMVAQEWKDGTDGMHVMQQQQCVGAAHCELNTAYTVSPKGRLLSVNGQPIDEHSLRRLNVLLPDGQDLTEGVQWADSAVLDSNGFAGEIHRTYHVQMILPQGGRDLAEIVGNGTMHMHGTKQIDSTRTLWFDVSGPVTETHWFDVRAGRMVSNFLTARLTGWGSMPNLRGGTDTLPAGASFDIKDRSVTGERAHLLARAMPGRDTTITTNAQGGVMFLHTLQHDGDEIDVGLARPDGWVRTATEHYSDGRPQSYDAVWSDTSVRCCTSRHVERRGDSLFVRRDNKDTTIGIPAVTWAIGDAMNQEMLVPVLLTLPHDNAPHPVAVYRPYEGKWTVWQAQVKETEGVYVIRMVVGAQDPEEWLIVSKSGDLMFAEQPRAQQPWYRMPPKGTTRRAAMDGLLKRLNPARVASGA
jgi:hypothetical protein